MCVLDALAQHSKFGSLYRPYTDVCLENRGASREGRSKYPALCQVISRLKSHRVSFGTQWLLRVPGEQAAIVELTTARTVLT